MNKTGKFSSSRFYVAREAFNEFGALDDNVSGM